MSNIPEILETGAVRFDSTKSYTITKIGSKTERRVQYGAVYHGQSYSGCIMRDLEIGKPAFVASMRTSWIQAIYIHGLTEYDELLYPLLGIYNTLDDLPLTEKLELPELEEGDLVLTTDNSIYHLTIQ